MDAFVITFREGLEAAVAIGVIAGYLAVTGGRALMKWVYAGVVAAVVASLAGGIALGGAAEVVENPLFEGVVYLTAAVFVTSMVVWMWRTGRTAAARIRDRVDTATEHEHAGWRAFGLFFVSFLLVAREGIETALFLVASSLGRARARGCSLAARSDLPLRSGSRSSSSRAVRVSTSACSSESHRSCF